MTEETPSQHEPPLHVELDHGSAIDKVGHIEKNDLEPIRLKYRHGSPKSLYGMWIGANTNYVVLLNGVLLITLGLSFWQAIAAVLVGNVMGCTMLGMASIMGPRTGMPGLVTSRTSFGQVAALFVTTLSAISVLGWFSINSVVATDGLVELLKLAGSPDNAIVLFVALLVILALEIVVAIYGHATILRLEAVIAVVLGALFFVVFLYMLPKMDWGWAGSAPTEHDATSWGRWLLAMGIMFAYPISWTNFASDYSRYLHPSTSWKKIALFAGGGQFTALCLTEFVGICVGIGSMTALGAIGDNPGSLVEDLLPVWFFALFMFAVILGGVATNVPNGYTAGLHLLTLRLPLKRVQAVLVIAGITLVFRIVTLIFGDFFQVYEAWLGVIVIWTCPWIAVVLADYFLRRGNYDSIGITQFKESQYWYRGGIFWPGLLAFVLGVGGGVLFTNSTVFSSPLMVKYFGGADLSYFAGIAVGLAVFVPLAYRHETYRKARAMTTSIFHEEDIPRE